MARVRGQDFLVAVSGNAPTQWNFYHCHIQPVAITHVDPAMTEHPMRAARTLSPGVNAFVKGGFPASLSRSGMKTGFWKLMVLSLRCYLAEGAEVIGKAVALK